MRRRNKAGGNPIKAGRRKATAPKRPNTPKTARPDKSPAAGQETEVARLRRELNEALEQQTATSEVLKVISSSPGELKPVFQAMLANATRICEAKFGILMLREGDGFRSCLNPDVLYGSDLENRIRLSPRVVYSESFL